MDRLTIEYCGEYVPKDLCSIDRYGEADDCDLCCDYCRAAEDGSVDCRGCAIHQCFNKLGEYEDLEEHGKLLKLFCHKGNTVYVLRDIAGKLCITTGIIEKVIPHGALVIEGSPRVWNIEIETDGTVLYKHFHDFGRTLFLVKEEAEEALKRMEDGK